MAVAYYCPKCGNPADVNVFFQVTGQCLYSKRGEVVDITTASETNPKDEDDEKHGRNED